MGRPIKKKFFANLNSPYQDHATGGPTGEGGESLVSVTINTEGSYTAGLPTVSFGDPDLFSGVRAQGIVHGHALSAATTANGTGYRVGDVLTVVGGTNVSAATFPVANITTLGIPGITNGGSLYDINSPTDGDKVTFTHTNLLQALRVRITAVNGSTATSIAVEQPGIWTGTGAFPTSMKGGVGGFTAATTAKVSPPGDTNGNGLELSFTSSNWGVYSFGTVAVQGDYTAMPANPASFTGGNGTGTAATITFGVSGIALTNFGSNYISAADAAITFSTGTATATSVLGNVRDNGLAAYAHILDGVEGALVDIMKQESSRRYLVKEDNGVQGQCRLVVKNTSDLYPGEMILIATDTQGCTYWVTKLTARRAYLKHRSSAGTGYQVIDGGSAGWNITGAVTGYVSIASV